EEDELAHHAGMPGRDRRRIALALHRVPARERAQGQDEAAEPGEALARAAQRSGRKARPGSWLRAQIPKAFWIFCQIESARKRVTKTRRPSRTRKRIRARLSSCLCSIRARRRARA